MPARTPHAEASCITLSNFTEAFGMSSSRSGNLCFTLWKPVDIWWSEIRPVSESFFSKPIIFVWIDSSSSIITTACLTHSWWKKGTFRLLKQWLASSTSWLVLYSFSSPCMLNLVASMSLPAPEPQHLSSLSVACLWLMWVSTQFRAPCTSSASTPSPPPHPSAILARTFWEKLGGRMSSITALAMKRLTKCTACGWSSRMSSRLYSTFSNPVKNCSAVSTLG
mmetsp:Transcript_5578/g.16947  ORF Transcript_5578/g.16947 Transcript_5578/m.16947 type:complete len:223 (-) Transcript_5578:1063-1731(-)